MQFLSQDLALVGNPVLIAADGTLVEPSPFVDCPGTPPRCLELDNVSATSSVLRLRYVSTQFAVADACRDVAYRIDAGVLQRSDEDCGSTTWATPDWIDIAPDALAFKALVICSDGATFEALPDASWCCPRVLSEKCAGFRSRTLHPACREPALRMEGRGKRHRDSMRDGTTLFRRDVGSLDAEPEGPLMRRTHGRDRMSSMTARSGIALITSLAILVVVSTLVLGSIFTTRVELAVTRNDNTLAQAQYVAQAGLQSTKAALFQNFRWLEGGSGTGSSLDACTNSLSGGIDFLRTGTVTPWVNDQILLAERSVTDAGGVEIGRYVVTLLRDPGNENRITVRSVGRTLDGGAGRVARATAAATFIIRNSSTLEQAIFAGSGSDMRFINGNTTIYGGIYIVGDLDDPETIVMESNGNLGLYNSYDKTGVGTFLDPAAQASSNLCAALRVQSGTVAVGGSTQFGRARARS